MFSAIKFLFFGLVIYLAICLPTQANDSSSQEPTVTTKLATTSTSTKSTTTQELKEEDNLKNSTNEISTKLSTKKNEKLFDLESVSMDEILNFTIYRNDSSHPCLRARFSLVIDIKYFANNSEKVELQTARINLTKFDSFNGTCEETSNTLNIIFNKDWLLVLNYTLNKDKYSLEFVKFAYKVDDEYFKNATTTELGEKVISHGGLNEFSVIKGKSFKCYAKTRIDLNSNVTLEFKNYQYEAFIGPDGKQDQFDTAVECFSDTVMTSKLVPIIVGSLLGVLIVFVLIAYIFGRRKHRPTYQQV